MEAKIITIGNSRGLRLPRKILEAAKLESLDTVKLTITAKGLLLSPPKGLRAIAAKEAVSQYDDLWEGSTPWDRFDETEWAW
jgi:antitoxin component of MazEF toxin-antitoxin module